MNGFSLHKHVKRALCGSALLIGAVSTSLSAQAAGYEGPRITFEQIYANPDDQQLNLNYARQQASKGDFISAAAALERMLFAQPDWDSARLFYALVLYKLDDKQAAFSELDVLNDRPLTPAQRMQANAYRKEFSETASQSEDNNFSGQFAVGLRYDNNAGNALTDSHIIVANDADFAVLLQGQLNYVVPLNDDGMKLTASVYGNSLRHETFPKADFDSFGGSIGFAGGIGDSWGWAIDGQAAQVHISGSKYLTQLGGQVKLSTTLGTNTTAWVSGGWYDQDYSELPITLLETTRSGDKIIGRAGFDYLISEDANFGASVGYEDKDAINPLFAYDGFRIEAHGFRGFTNGVYMRGDLTYRNLDYGGPSPARKDTNTVGHASMGTSLNTLGQWMGMSPNLSLKKTYLEVGGSFVSRNSNSTTSNFDNVGADMKLLWTF